jgi:hypothetical protein
MTPTRCISCDGYGWLKDDFTDEETECDWCDGVGYIYRDEQGIDHKIPATDWGKVADALEKLEEERLREIGYTGKAKKPWDQDVRKGTQGGENPYEKENGGE